ncbi:MAG: peptidylprolyl isomerase [Chitinophagaceae bacterium]|nr:peptidylprolyl isomerase [Chitinophagaceae bacterium]
MNKLRIGFTILLLIFSTIAVQAQKKKPVAKKPVATKKTTPVKKTVKPSNTTKPVKLPGTRVKLITDSGVIVIRLYNKTPKHRDNFIKLANERFFDSLLFHRVINGFMIQGGDPASKNAPPGIMLGSGDVGYTIPAEFDTSLFHKKGALAAARTPNPEKASSGCQFYIVQGKAYTDADLNMIEMQKGIRYSPAKRKIYKTLGGTPFLDMDYTVFGEVESGLEVIDKIASVATDGANRPLGDIRMHIEVIKQ